MSFAKFARIFCLLLQNATFSRLNLKNTAEIYKKFIKIHNKNSQKFQNFTKNSFHLLFLCEICAIITLTFGSDLASTGVEWLRWHTALDKALKVRQNLNANNAKFAPAYAKIA